MKGSTVDVATTIYVGAGHSSNSKCIYNNLSEYENEVIDFQTKRGKPLELQVKVCKRCNAVFLSYKKYKKHWVDFIDYKFVRTKTGKEPSEELLKHGSEEFYGGRQINKKIELETPDYIKFGLKHPFQGGSMR